MKLHGGGGYLRKFFWHSGVNFEIEYFGKFEVVCENALWWELREHGEKFDEKNPESKFHIYKK
jgi:hypothetical protein